MIKILIAIYLSILSVASGNSLDSVTTYRDHFLIALKHYESERYMLAETEFKKILIDRKSFSDPVTHLLVAKSQYFQNKLIECQRTCNSFLNKYQKSKYDVDVRTLLGDIFIKQEQYADAIEQLLSIRHETTDSILQNSIDTRILSSIMIGINSDKIERLLFNCNLSVALKLNSSPNSGFSSLNATSFPKLIFESNEINSIGLVIMLILVEP